MAATRFSLFDLFLSIFSWVYKLFQSVTGLSDDQVLNNLLKLRWIPLLFIVVPLSLGFEAFFSVRNWFFYKFISVPAAHEARVREVQKAVRAWNDGGRVGKLCTARNSWQMMSTRRHEYKKDNHAVPLGLYDIIEVNEEKMTVTCEPLVNVGHVTGTLVPRGLTLPVVPEMDDLTIGGLLAGYGIEASSHKYGLFNDIVVSVELVTSEGSVIKCSREENSDLFHAIPWSYGGLGFVTAVEIKMIRAQPFVRIEYVPYTDYDKLMKDFAAESMKTKDGHEFLEIIQYSKTTAVFMKADFASAESASYWQRNSIGLWYKPWFYKHVESVLSRPKGAPLVEYIPLREYYHRHTRSIFWELELLIPFGNNPLFRLLAGWMMPPKVSFIRLTEGELLHKYHREKHVAQDVLVPLDRVKACVEHFDKIFDIYPLWIVPHAVYRTEPQGAIRIADGKDEEMYADVGVWFAPGPVRKNEPYDAMAAIHNMEQWLIANRGYQALYAFSMLSREDHRKMFDMSLYDSLRKKYKADGAFLDVYEKIKKNH